MKYLKYYSTSSQKNILYSLFELDKSFKPSELRSKYHKLCLKYHPDHNNGRKAKFLETKKAYEILSDSAKKREYDNLIGADYEQFEQMWKTEFALESETGLDLVLKMKGTGIPMSPQMQILLSTNFQSIYDRFFKRKTYTKSFNRNSHLYFIQDNSGSMYRCEFNNDQKLDRCLAAIQNLFDDLKDNKTVNNITFSIFSNDMETVISRSNVNQALNQIKNFRQHLWPDKARGTWLYGSLFKAITDVEDKDLLPITTFIVLYRWSGDR